MISKDQLKYATLIMAIILMVLIGSTSGVTVTREYYTNAPALVDQWNQYRWEGENYSTNYSYGVSPINSSLYKGGSAVVIPPGGVAVYFIYWNQTHVKHGVYRMFILADTTNPTGPPPIQSPVDLWVYIDWMQIQIDHAGTVPPPNPPGSSRSVVSPAAINHPGIINVGWIDFCDWNHTLPGYHVIEFVNGGNHGNTIKIDEFVIATAN